MKTLAIILVILAGVFGSIIPACNAQLAKFIPSTGGTPLVIGVTGLIGLLILAPILGLSLNEFKQAVTDAPWWAWLGGVLGIVGIIATVIAIPRIGVGAYACIFIAASLIAALLIDHYGWLGTIERPAGLPRLAGAALMVLGVLLVVIN